MYDSLGDAEMRLLGTVIRVDGMPVLVDNISKNGDEEDFLLKLTSLISPYKTVFARLGYAGVDLSSAPLGYCNINSKAYFLARNPARRQKQGIDPRHVQVYHPTNGGCHIGVSAKEVGLCVQGTFVSIQKFIEKHNELVEERYSALALSRDIALSSDTIYYHTFPIGTFSKNGDRFEYNINKPIFKYYNFKGVFGDYFRAV